MAMPTLTHLQFLALSGLAGGEQSGRSLRESMSAEGAKLSPPSFYQLMARLEADGFVEGRYISKEIHGQVIRERIYQIRGEGERAIEQTLGFYLEQSKRGLLGA